jgi:hypothetical protein
VTDEEHLVKSKDPERRQRRRGKDGKNEERQEGSLSEDERGIEWWKNRPLLSTCCIQSLSLQFSGDAHTPMAETLGARCA